MPKDLVRCWADWKILTDSIITGSVFTFQSIWVPPKVYMFVWMLLFMSTSLFLDLFAFPISHQICPGNEILSPQLALVSPHWERITESHKVRKMEEFRSPGGL